MRTPNPPGALLVVALSALAGMVRPAWSQVPAGPEFQVNTYTTGHQLDGTVAISPKGVFVVAWTDGPTQIRAQRYDASGARRGGEFQVNTYTTSQRIYSASADAAGNFVVAWNRGTLGDAAARRFGADGVARGPEFVLNTYTTGDQLRPSVAIGPGTAFVAAWSSAGQDGSGGGVFARRYDRNGLPIGAEFLVNTYTTSYQDRPQVAVSADGRFVIVWDSYLQAGARSEIYVQRHDAAGNRIGGEFQVNTYTTGFQNPRSLAMAPDGRFVVVWDGDLQDGSATAILARRFDAAGNAVGAEFGVNTFTIGYQLGSSVAMDASGRFVVAWEDFTRGEVFAQRFTADGVPRGGEFRVNTYLTGRQQFPFVASDEVGNFVVTWDAYGQDGNEGGVFGQRFGGLHPQALVVDTAGNGVWEPGEQVDVRPSWRNSTGSPQTFTADLSGLGGPPGATYTLVDGTGSYGTVADGMSAPCTDCYVVAVNSPASRPALDWDGTVAETIAPDLLGQLKTWRLHVGDSFTDVPRTSGFYQFVETLLHRAVTGGCGPAVYCPTSSVSREQMAVFLLAAKEAAGYAPPACTTPVFGDVPASSPFCSWIEELARRSVTGGCGGGNYCPADAVTREVLSVFVLRTLDPALNPPACTPPNIFNDVPETNPFCRWIEELARRGIAGGCGGGNYCPTAPVSREQMAVFLTVAFGLTLYGP